LADRGTIRTEVAEAAGALVYSGTADSATSSTLVDTELTFATDDDLKGFEVRIKTGTGINQVRRITASSASSNNITVSPNFSPTPAANDTYDIYEPRRARERLLTDAITSGVRMAKNRGHVLEKVDSRLITQDILQGQGSFQQPFTSGVPDGDWAKDANSTAAKETTIIYQITKEDLASAKLTSDGTNEGYLEFTIPDWALYAGKSITVRGWIYTDTASRVRLRLLDGVDTGQTDQVTTANKWVEVSSSLTVNAAPTKLTVQCYISSGAAVVAYFHHIKAITSEPLYEFPIPVDSTANFAWIHRVDVETGTPGVFRRLRNVDWAIQRGGTPTLQIYRVGFSPGGINTDNALTLLPSNRKIRIFGAAFPTIPTSDTTDLDPLDEFIKAYAIWYVLSLQRIKASEGESHANKMFVWERVWKQFTPPVPLQADSRQVQRGV